MVLLQAYAFWLWKINAHMKFIKRNMTYACLGIHLLFNFGFQAFYKASKLRFDEDPVFKEKAQRAVVSLQVDYMIISWRNFIKQHFMPIFTAVCR